MSDTELSCKSFTIMCFAKNSEQLLLHKNYSLVLAKKKKKKRKKKKNVLTNFIDKIFNLLTNNLNSFEQLVLI